MRYKNKFSFRVFCVVAVFLLACVIFAVRMISICASAEPGKIDTGTYERREPINAVRGEIYDRNGKKIVGNTYTYDLVLDYDAMAATQLLRNYDILKLLGALDAMKAEDKMGESSFPFEGAYPNYKYSSEALDTESNIYYRLLKRIAENELETDSEKPKNQLTVSYLDEFYRQNPDKFPTEDEIVDYYIKRYSMADDEGNILFDDKDIDRLLRARYDMEVADFSIYNRYTVASDVDLSFITYIEELSIPGVAFEKQAHREYPYPGYASHILGQLGNIPAEAWSEYKAQGYDMNDMVGLSGCEMAFEEYLRGEDGVRVVVEDKNGNIIDSYVEKEAIAGNDVYLTIDIDLQIAAEDALEENVALIGDAQAGALCAIDPQSGEVLVLASYPSFDLGTYNENYNDLVKDPANPLYNRVLNGVYTPGSTFKVGMVAAGITSGVVSSSTTLRCDGIYTYYDDYQPKCWYYPNSHGNVNAAYSLEVSCNCYFYELGRIMGINVMNEYCRAYGLGEHTGIELPEKVGILAGPEYREENGLLGWTAGNTIAAAIGQSDNSFTPLQLANYIATVTNGGTRYSVHLLKEVRTYGENGKTVFSTENKILSQINLSSDALYGARQGMKQMAQHDSAVSRYMQGLPVTVGAKTGTAQRGPEKNDNRLFVCAAPYDNPDIVISVVIEPDDNVPKDNSHGSSYASFAASEVLKEFYK
ncbi:MAG: peptidoglycan D,D-transpeptidase FtsI family protein [Eubacteriales bacterium]